MTRDDVIEAMAKAYWAGWNDGETWDELDRDLQKSVLRNIRFALSALEAMGIAIVPVESTDWTNGTQWEHLKTGRIYTTVGRCRLEASGEPAVLYCGSEGTIWARAMDEFLDGRFDRLPGGHAQPQRSGDRPEIPNDGRLREPDQTTEGEAG